MIIFHITGLQLDQQHLLIYKVIQAHFGCDFPEMLFIGDHPILDVETPISLGMKARLIERHKNQRLLDVMGDLI